VSFCSSSPGLFLFVSKSSLILLSLPILIHSCSSPSSYTSCCLFCFC
jgi:hypothetical protein